MSLVISADGQKLDAQKGTPFWTSQTEFSIAVWVKVTTAQWGNIFGACDFANAAYNTAPLRTAAGTAYDHGLRLQGNDRRMDTGGSVTGGWDLIVLTYKKDGSRIAYKNGSASQTTTTNMAEYWAGGVGFDYVSFGTMPYDSSNVRAKMAHGAVWNKELTAAEVASLYNGGTAGAGKNPTAVQNANLVFYAPLTSDATVTTGGVTLTATGSPTYDGADNPNVDAASGSGPTTSIAATTANVVGSLSSSQPATSAISATTANTVGSVASVSGTSSSSISATTANTVGSVTSVGNTANGTFTSEALRDNVGNLIASKALNFVCLYNDTTGALVVRKTGLSTNSSGIFSFTDAAITAGVTYRVDWEDVDGKRRMPRKAAA